MFSRFRCALEEVKLSFLDMKMYQFFSLLQHTSRWTMENLIYAKNCSMFSNSMTSEFNKVIRTAATVTRDMFCYNWLYN